MTSQTKHYIEIADLLFLRLDCKHCNASLAIALREETARSIDFCPSCNKPWAQKETQKTIGDFLRQLEVIRSQLKTVDFNLYFEVSAPASTS